jgi:hypothetical protein
VKTTIKTFDTTKPSTVIPDFGTHISQHVHYLASPQLGGRVRGSAGSRLARDYILHELEACENISCRTFEKTGTTIIGTWNPGNHDEYILLGAHYDTVPGTPGAGDNAAAVAIVLEIARYLGTMHEGKHGVLLAFFDCEEPPYFQRPTMGSTEFLEHDTIITKDKIQVALILDCLGHWPRIPTENKKFIFATGAENARQLFDVVLNEITRALPLVPVQNDLVGDMSDHHVFNENDIPFLFFSAGRNEHYHAHTDTPENIEHDYVRLAAETIFDVLCYLLRVTAIDFERDVMVGQVRQFLIKVLAANGVDVSEENLDQVLRRLEY